jgi:glyoxylase-like metal-dependent hydrolase (beta-lactamase superfamily II)
VRVVALHEDVLVGRSAYWQTSCTVIHRGDETFVVDSPPLPEELEALGGVLEHVGWSCSGLLATHADWDHLLGRLAFPRLALGCCETSAARLTAEPGAAARELRAFDEQNYVERPAPLSLGQVQALPVPGVLEIGDQELELYPADGHTADGMAIFVPWAEVLICGDYLSPVEIPMISEGGSRSAYRATLERLRELVERSEHVIPGHGSVLDRTRALAILGEDLKYLETLELPLARRGSEQQKIHAANLARIEAELGA